MFIFIDDSGDAGLKFAEGSSTHIVMSAVIFKNPDEINQARDAVAKAHVIQTPTKQVEYKREFKYSKCSSNMRDKFFADVASAPFTLRAICFDKRKLYSSHLLENPNDMKSYLIRQLLTHTDGTVSDAKLIIDGQDTRAFNMSDRSYFMRKVNECAPGTLRDVEFADSKRNPLIQIADMTAGAIRRNIVGDAEAHIHFESFSQRLWRANGGSLWHFGGRSGG